MKIVIPYYRPTLVGFELFSKRDPELQRIARVSYEYLFIKKNLDK